MATRYALHASAVFHDHVVEERFVNMGQDLQIGNSSALAVPVPEGVPYIARVEWVGPSQLRVIDGRGHPYLLGPERDVDIRIGPVGLHLSLVPQFPLKRIDLPSWKGSLAWLTIVVMTTTMVQQAQLLWDKRCEWFGVLCPAGDANGGEGADGVDVTAEYLARLLREDFAGDEQGLITTEIERPDSERKANDVKHFYMPAGQDGPITAMGGAAETAPEPIRTPAVEERPLAEAKPRNEPTLHANEVGTPVFDLPKVESSDGDALAEASGADADADATVSDAPAEEQEGWGIPDWYDEQDQRMDQVEIDVMLQQARRRLAIDPDDRQALSVLSYYQYLAQDYDAARRTYERYIALYPDEAAGFNNMALVYKRLGDYAREENLYRVALSLEPFDVTAMNNLGVNLAHQKRFDEALAIMKELESLDPDDPYAELHRSKIYAEMGDDAAALRYLEKALEGMKALDTLHHIEFRQDIRLDPSFEALRGSYAFRALLDRFYGQDSPLQE